MSASRFRTAAAARFCFIFVGWLASGCQPAAPPASPAPAPSASPSLNAPASEAAAQKEARTVVVFAAASTQEAVEEIAKAFQTSHPEVEIDASFASSATLAKQITEGASADLFLSASPQWVDSLQKMEMIAERHDLLGNELVVVVPADSTLSITAPEGLLQDEVTHIALGDPDSVPAGIYAKEALSKLGLWEKLADKLAAAEDVRHALAMVETGAAETGIVYATDVAVSKKAKLAFTFERGLTEPIVYPLALTRREVENPAAVAFYRYLQSEPAAEVFRGAGFRVQQAAGAPQP